MKYSTPRLAVQQLAEDMPADQLQVIGTAAQVILSPSVVAHLPPNFQNIQSLAAAQGWLENMLAESTLLTIRETSADQHQGPLMGFVFVYVDDQDAHLGYLLGEAYWGKGFASEFLAGLLAYAKQHTSWGKLIGGVGKENQASSHVLSKLGFVAEHRDSNGTTFYAYQLR